MPSDRLDIDRTWTCARCGEPIGVYEPAVAVDGTAEHRTSRLAESSSNGQRPRVRYHASCRAAPVAGSA